MTAKVRNAWLIGAGLLVAALITTSVVVVKGLDWALKSVGKKEATT